MGHKKESQEKTHFELNENEKPTYQTLWDAAKAVLRGKFINSECIYWKGRFRVNNLIISLRKLKNKE